MKVVLTASRNRALDRPSFFRHLRQVHWPLVRSFPSVLREIRGYQQNHSFLPDEDGAVSTPWRRAIERDSVIEVWFESLEGLKRMDEDPEYAAHVRPDEAVFNDLPSNVILLSDERVFHKATSIGRVKRFDFLYSSEHVTKAAFEQACVRGCEAISIDPLFQAIADRVSLHLPLVGAHRSVDGLGAVLAVNTSGLDAMNHLASSRFTSIFENVFDAKRCFSVLTTSFPIHGVAAEPT